MLKKFLGFLPFLATTSLFAQGNGQSTGREGNFVQTIVMIGIAIIFFYFILFRPEQKRRKALEKKRSEMKKGDKATAMGIVGTIDRIEDNTVILKMVEGAKIEVLKASITEVQPASGEKTIEVEKTPAK